MLQEHRLLLVPVMETPGGIGRILFNALNRLLGLLRNRCLHLPWGLSLSWQPGAAAGAWSLPRPPAGCCCCSLPAPEYLR